MAKKQWTYHFGVDDIVIFLEDLAKKNKFLSLFEQPYLAFWKEMHNKYGVKIHFNIHGERGKFNISQIPALYKQEWLKNSDWIRLSFHQVGSPSSLFSYKNSSFQDVKKDYQDLITQIERFAGKELISPFTTIHHAAVSKDGLYALKACGVRGLGAASWREEKDGKIVTPPNYCLTKKQMIEIDKKGYIKDEELGLYFFNFDVILHHPTVSIEKIIQGIKNTISNDEHWQHLEVTFEEYAFDPEDSRFMKDAKERVEGVLSFMQNSNIRSVFLEEVM